jgi:hypothetical protein
MKSFFTLISIENSLIVIFGIIISGPLSRDITGFYGEYGK